MCVCVYVCAQLNKEIEVKNLRDSKGVHGKGRRRKGKMIQLYFNFKK